MHATSLILVGAFSLILAGCRTSAQDYIGKGNEYFKKKDYGEAGLNYRKALQKDPALGEAHYRLALNEIELGNGVNALLGLTRASELMPGNLEVKSVLADVTLSAYLSAPEKSDVLYSRVASISDDLLKNDSNSFDGLRLKGYLALTDKRVTESIDAFRRANAVKPDEPPVIAGWAEALFLSDKAPEAEALILGLIDKKPSFAPLYDRLYRYYIETKRTQDAERLLKKKSEKNPGQSAPRLQLAAHYRRERQASSETEALNSILNEPKAFPDGHLLVGDYYATVGSWGEARTQYEAGLKAAPGNAATYRKRLSQAFAAEGKTDQAISELDQAIKLNASDSDAKQTRANLLLASGTTANIDRAINAFQELMQQKANDPALRLQLGKAFLARGNLVSAKAHLQEAERLDKASLEPKLQLAEIARRQGDFRGMLTYTNAALAINTADPTARFLRGVALSASGSFQQARTELNQLRKEHPASVDVQLQLGAVDLAQKQYKDAEDRLRQSIRPGSKDLRPFLGLVQTYRLQGRQDLAVQMLTKEVSRDPNDTDLRLLLAATEAASGHFEQALGQYEKLAAQNPRSAEFRAMVAQAYQAKGNVQKALENYQNARQLDSKDVRIVAAVAYMEEQAGLKKEAMKSYHDALALDPNLPVILNNLAYLTADTNGSLAEAEQMARKAVQAEPDNGNFLDTLGLIYLKKNEPANALQVFSRLSSKYPANPLVRYRMGSALIQKGDRTQARTELEAALRSKPSPNLESEIRNMLGKL